MQSGFFEDWCGLEMKPTPLLYDSNLCWQTCQIQGRIVKLNVVQAPFSLVRDLFCSAEAKQKL